MLALEGVAYAHLRLFPEAESTLGQAELSCSAISVAACGNVIRANGVLAIERGNLDQAQQFFMQSLSFARSDGDKFLEATALLNLGAASLKEEHFDEAIDRSNEALRLSVALDAGDVSLVASENLGWAYYNLGDPDKALELLLDAENNAFKVGDIVDQVSLLTDVGYVYARLNDFSRAKQAYLQALNLARQIKTVQHTFNALRALALVSVESDELDDACKYSDEAIKIAQADNNRLDELYPLLVKGLVAARSGSGAEAERVFREVEQDQNANASLKWRAEHGLARLYEDGKHPKDADHEYRAAVATFEQARSSLRRNDARLPFSNNASRIYDDYIHFLVARGKTDDALRWADYSRARTLSEGLGVLSKVSSKGGNLAPPAQNPKEIARQAKGVLLFYWLGEKQSYLWAITPQKTSLFPLPPGPRIEAAVQRYRAALTGPQDILSGEDGSALYRMLIAPAQSLLAKDAKVYILPDGALNNLSFETLVVPSSTPHFWIEDADVVNSSSLRVLAASLAHKETRSRKLLLMGNSVAASKDYPELPKAADQMASVAKDFPANEERVFQREQATPAAYLENHPEEFSHIHFVAHGTASRLSPLDSAIVLSKEPGNSDSFKLYARDIIQHRLRADLVTISACYGSGERAYSGEGLVGLAWAFLRAGAHNVIAALWDVSDASTDQLMDRFYAELAKGSPPDTALRAAKLSLLRNSPFRNPFYWAPFQLYVG